jgi:hypothetical protein
MAVVVDVVAKKDAMMAAKGVLLTVVAVWPVLQLATVTATLISMSMSMTTKSGHMCTATANMPHGDRSVESYLCVSMCSTTSFSSLSLSLSTCFCSNHRTPFVFDSCCAVEYTNFLFVASDINHNCELQKYQKK